MLLAVDIGNTNIVIGLHDSISWSTAIRLETLPIRPSDQYSTSLRRELARFGIEPHIISQLVLCSVVPDLTEVFRAVLYRVFNLKPLVVNKTLNTGLLKESIPAELGNDLLANAAAAHYKYPEAYCMVVDFGTALTFTTTSPTGAVLGAAIVPGIVSASTALFSNAAQLESEGIVYNPKSILGRTSKEAVSAGVMFGYASLIEGIISKTALEIQKSLTVIATGGYSSHLAPSIQQIDELDIYHTLEGLRLIHSLN
jgi:type III pantothenate kinase